MQCKVCLSKVENIKQKEYHSICLKRLFGTSHVNPVLDFDKNQFEVELLQKFSKKMSISGLQHKLSVRVEKTKITPTDIEGTHILKPASQKFPGICENEHVSMKIAALLGIETAECGLISFKNAEHTYITKRFDREGENKIAQEDMTQILEKNSNKNGDQYKYKESYERVAKTILATTGKLSVVYRFYERLVFNYLIANGDYHLKNISLRFMEAGGKYRELTPLYDSVNTRIHIPNESSDLALEDLFSDGSFTEKYDQYGYYTAFDFMEFAKRIGVSEKAAKLFFEKIKNLKTYIINLINRSYLTPVLKKKYQDELLGRYARLFERG